MSYIFSAVNVISLK